MIDDNILHMCFTFHSLNHKIGESLDIIKEILINDSEDFQQEYIKAKILSDQSKKIRVEINSLCVYEDLCLLYLALAQCLTDEDFIEADKMKNRIIKFNR